MLYLYRFKDNWSNTTFTRNQAIQDHLSLGRARYAAEFARVNSERLKADPSAPGTQETVKGVLLTVGVCMTSTDLATGSMPTVHELLRQAKDKRVEILCMLEEDPSKFGEKRNALIEGANGRFVSFVDPDGQIESDYVSAIVEAIEKSPESDCIVFDVLVHGRSPQPKVCKYDCSQLESEGSLYFYRKPDQTMVWRKDIARENPYTGGQGADMTQWSEKASKAVKKQLRVQKTLYHTLHDPVGKTRLVLPPPEQSKSSTPAPVSKTLADVSFIVLEAVTSDLTVRCLESIRKWAKDSEIVLVANGCLPLPGAAAYADKIERLDTNLGFAAGCNAGAMVATKPILCFMNNDAAFVDETPSKLLGAMNETHPIVAPFSNRAKPPQGDRAHSETPDGDMFPDMVVGLCMMIPKDLYNELGGFDPRLLTYEDDELCQKARMKGKLCKVVGGTWVEHERHATFKALGLDPQEVMNHNRIVFGLKNPVIRVIVIAKDEEKAIEGFFSQFKGITHDWCLLDTGSTDRTVEVAKSLGVRVETGALKDFASARNEAIDRFGEGADWIVMFDPDERLDEHTLKHFRELIYPARHEIFLAPLYATYPDGSKRDFVAKPFLFRNLVNIRWIFKVHEKLIGSHQQALVKNASINHVIALHEDGRRQKAAGMYDALMKAEPYFTDPKYKEQILKKWPILDYDRMDDPRIEKIYTGPLISVVIPTFKRTSLLNKAIVSALKQDYANLEVIVVGDACPELGVIFTGSHHRIRAYNLSNNHGAGGAVPRNHAIKAAAGRLIAYLDDDNEWKPNHVSSIYEAMRKEQASFGFSSMEVSGKDLKFTEPKYQGIDTSCVIHLKDLVEKYGGWKDRIEGGYAHDWEFISRWVNGQEPWVCTRKATLIYNAETSGQADFWKTVADGKQT
jgi:GT2 family glycosyltransferase